MSIQSAWQGTFSFFQHLPIIVEPSRTQLSSDAGLLVIRAFDERIGLTRQFVDALEDPRHPELIGHSFLEMARARIYGILADYEDQNDHDTLRHDPVFKLIADRSPDGPDLASQPTLSRFENAINIPSLKKLRDVFIDEFIASFPTPPKSLTFDMDAVDDPAHGAPATGALSWLLRSVPISSIGHHLCRDRPVRHDFSTTRSGSCRLGRR